MSSNVAKFAFLQPWLKKVIIKEVLFVSILRNVNYVTNKDRLVFFWIF